MVKIKFCGLKRIQDLEKAISLRVDYVGFVLYPKSPRYVSPEELKALVNLSNSVKKVAVMVNPDYQDVKKVLDIGVDLIQLHGEESFDFAKKVGFERVIKAFRVKEKIYISQEWRQVHAVLLDTYSQHLYGGTGRTFNWSIAEELVKNGFRIILSGGLTPENVQMAVRRVNPYGVDVSSGVEVKPGVKDHQKMEAFVRALRSSLS
jgi:phosphoribosylanthranilate isomerase